MEIYIIKIDKQAQKDIEKIQKSGNKSDIRRFEKIFEELSVNPRFGIGNPERLKHYEGEVWSRQLNKKDK
ncbi:MAG: type II toxin-antitoxin system YoeB family toxin [Bergeyella sp.]